MRTPIQQLKSEVVDKIIKSNLKPLDALEVVDISAVVREKENDIRRKGVLNLINGVSVQQAYDEKKSSDSDDEYTTIDLTAPEEKKTYTCRVITTTNNARIFILPTMVLKKFGGDKGRSEFLANFYQAIVTKYNKDNETAITVNDSAFIGALGVRGRFEMLHIGDIGHTISYAKAAQQTETAFINPRGNGGPQSFFNDTYCAEYSTCLVLHMLQQLVKNPQKPHDSLKNDAFKAMNDAKKSPDGLETTESIEVFRAECVNTVQQALKPDGGKAAIRARFE